MIKMAADLSKGDRFVLRGERSNRIATVQLVEDMVEADLLPPGMKFASRDPIVGIHVFLNHPIPVPAIPQWRTSLWTVWADPDELIEICD